MALKRPTADVIRDIRASFAERLPNETLCPSAFLVLAALDSDEWIANFKVTTKDEAYEVLRDLAREMILACEPSNYLTAN